ncbi:DUF2339 domain-containing protein [Synechococcus sp. PCC 6312]|uniref:DUF2339 domain-containing protein n=1 Tax=Synechococcus sp. (strain ATCC 27167 / PCC 6312) TaxID=195253 RepID=UPI00029EEABE|nr:DUF2339 domain-containing protein [Synechococcus sp. PCC 6312]AFY62159.1 putative membrane protein (DUF2339) [Synechococcus sp. PCC 6312]
MADQTELYGRIAELEAQVARHQSQIQELQSLLNLRKTAANSSKPAAPVPETLPPILPPTGTRPRPPRKPLPQPASKAGGDWLQNWEFWLNRFGIGLLLLGIIFLFKYALDQGWLTAYLLVAVGFLIGAGLLGLGWRLRPQRRAFSQILAGGGLATFYITSFAAFQVLKVFSYPVAFGIMLAVTVAAFWLSLGEQQAVFSVLGATGGLATPFLLFQDSGSVIGLSVYTLLILAGSLAVYRRQAWLSLYGTTFFLGSLVFLIAIFGAARMGDDGDTNLEKVVVQVGILGLSLGYGLVPFTLANLTKPGPCLEIIGVINPFIGLGLTAGLWNWSEGLTGWVALGLAIIYGLGGLQGAGWRGTLWLTAALLAVTAILVHLVVREIVFIPLTGEAILLLWLGRKYQSQPLTILGHIFWGILGAALLGRLLILPAQAPPFLNTRALVDETILAAGIGVAWQLPKSGRWPYGVVAYSGLLILIQREVSGIAPGLVTVCWGLCGIGLLVLGLRRDSHLARIIGLLTLGLTILKLFFFDLIGVEAIWRVLLFMGFGVMFLLLSYYFRSLWRPLPPSGDQSEDS